jgi:hypothetical protein
MKTSRLIAATTAAHAILFGSFANAQTIPAVPTGTLTVNQSIVRAGTFPVLTWNITYPQTVVDVVTIKSDGTLTPKIAPQTMDINVLGASVIAVTLDYCGNVISSYYCPVEAQFAYNNSWQRVFYGNLSQVNPATVVYSKTITSTSGTSLDFGGRYYFNGSYGTFFNTINNTNGNKNILALKNGDYPPTTSPLYGQPTIASFLQPYMDPATKRIIIGPKQVILLFELTDTDTGSSGFDLQDLVLLVTFR